MTRLSTAPKEAIVNATPTHRKSVFLPILTGLAGAVVGAKMAERGSVDRRDRAPVLPADAAEVLARADAHKKEYYAAVGRWHNFVISLIAIVMAGFATLAAAWGRAPADPDHVRAAAAFGVIGASALRALPSLRATGWKRWPGTVGVTLFYMAVWFLVYAISPDVRGSFGYTFATLTPALLMLAQLQQDEITMLGQNDDPKTFAKRWTEGENDFTEPV